MAPKHHAEGNRVLVGRVEVARFTDDYQAKKFIEFIERKERNEKKGRQRGDHKSLQEII